MNSLEPYDTIMARVWDRLIRLLGVHTVLVLVERAQWMALQSYNEATNIEFDESGVRFGGLADVPSEQANLAAQEFVASLMSVMTRLVGIEISRRIGDELDTLIGREVSACDE